MKLNNLIGLFIIMVFSVLVVMAGDPFKVDENLELGENDIYNVTNVNATNLYGILAWSNLTSYPAACPSNTYLTQLADATTCTAISDVYLSNTGDTGVGAYTIDMNSNAVSLVIDSEATTNSGIHTEGMVTTGPLIMFKNDGIMTLKDAQDRAGVMWIEQDHASSEKPVIHAVNAGTGKGLYIDQNGNGIGLEIDSEATTSSKFALKIVADQGATPMTVYANNSQDFFQKGTSVSANGNWFYRDLSSLVTAGPVVFIEQDKPSDDQPALTIQQDGTGDALEIQSGTLTISDMTAGKTESITLSSTGQISMATNPGTYLVIDTYEAAASDNLSCIDQGINGQIIWLRPADNARTVVLRHHNCSSGEDRISVDGKADFPMDSLTDGAICFNGAGSASGWRCMTIDGG